MTVEFTLVPPDRAEYSLLPEGFDDTDLYEEGCEMLLDNGQICGGKVVSTGGHHHYSNGFDCYTMYLRCERCGDYEVECV